MKVIDLTHTIKENMPVYPGTNPPSLSCANTYENDGFKETLLSMFSHTGTHIDPPAHIFKDKATLDSFQASQFVGSALVIDCRSLKDGEEISLDMIKNMAIRRRWRSFCFSISAGTKGGEHPSILGTIHAYLTTHLTI